MTTTTTVEYLTSHGIKPSVQRIAVMDYLLENHTHPTVEEIYNDLHEKMPTLSKTTVYNTLKLLTEHEAISQLTIDEHRSCYDADTSKHAHFLCNQCGKVYDIRLLNDRLESIADIPANFTACCSALYFIGCCSECAGKEDKQ